MPPLPVISQHEVDFLRTSGIDYVKSEILCRMAIASYLEEENHIVSIIGQGWHLEAWLDSSIENQGFIAWRNGVVVVSFRGSDSISDWLRNFKALWPERHPLGGRRHNGFHEIWSQKSDYIIDMLDNVIYSNSQLWLVGHSLGGAVATAASADFILNRPSRVQDFHVVTFGAPRYGSEQFQAAYDGAMLGKHWFYANEKDPIPHLPSEGLIAAGYRHVGLLKYFNSEGMHVAISREAVGLHEDAQGPEAAARNSWNNLEGNLNDNFQEIEQELLRDVEDECNNSVPRIVDNRIEIDDNEGQLHGDSFWSSSAHKKELYWRRIRNMLN